MEVTHSTAFFAGVFATSLFLAPPPIEAKTFGYVGLKTGYSHEMLPRTAFTQHDNLAYLKATSAIGLPVGVNIGVGYDFSPRFRMRMEAEYTYRFVGKFKGDVLRNAKGQLPSSDGKSLFTKPNAQIQSLLGNFYFDYYASPLVNLYLSVGVGVGHFGTLTDFNPNVGESIKLTSRFKTMLNWQVGLGVGYAITENLGLDFNVRYIDLGKSPLESVVGSIKARYVFSAVEALIGLNFRF